MRAALLDLLDPHLKDARVLDLFAGTGALGLTELGSAARLKVTVTEWLALALAPRRRGDSD